MYNWFVFGEEIITYFGISIFIFIFGNSIGRVFFRDFYSWNFIAGSRVVIFVYKGLRGL